FCSKTPYSVSTTVEPANWKYTVSKLELRRKYGCVPFRFSTPMRMSSFCSTSNDWFGSLGVSKGRKLGMSFRAPAAEPISSSFSRSNQMRGAGDPHVVANSRILVMAPPPLPTLTYLAPTYRPFPLNLSGTTGLGTPPTAPAPSVQSVHGAN